MRNWRAVFIIGIFALGFAELMPIAVKAQEAAKPTPAKEDAGAKEAPKDDAKPEAKTDEGGGGKKSKGPTDITGGRFAGDPVFVHIAPLILPIISDKGVEQIVTMQITLQIVDVAVADDIHMNMPRVRDALMRSLYGGLGKGSLRDGKLVDVVRVKARTMQAMDDLLGEGKVRDVLIEGIAQRML